MLPQFGRYRPDDEQARSARHGRHRRSVPPPRPNALRQQPRQPRRQRLLVAPQAGGTGHAEPDEQPECHLPHLRRPCRRYGFRLHSGHHCANPSGIPSAAGQLAIYGIPLPLCARNQRGKCQPRLGLLPGQRLCRPFRTQRHERGRIPPLRRDGHDGQLHRPGAPPLRRHRAIRCRLPLQQRERGRQDAQPRQGSARLGGRLYLPKDGALGRHGQDGTPRRLRKRRRGPRIRQHRHSHTQPQVHDLRHTSHRIPRG